MVLALTCTLLLARGVSQTCQEKRTSWESDFKKTIIQCQRTIFEGFSHGLLQCNLIPEGRVHQARACDSIPRATQKTHCTVVEQSEDHRVLGI
jgi:hypothetical protein